VSLDADLADAATYQNGPPHALFARLRAEAPVCWHPESNGPGFWALTKHADVLSVSRDSATFSSARAGYMVQDMDPLAVAQSRLMLLGMDPPEHTRLRGLVNRGFTPRQVARLGPRIRELSRAIVEAVAPRGQCDFVADVSGELPSLLIAELLGIPPACTS
jgi:cytochrome P450